MLNSRLLPAAFQVLLWVGVGLCFLAIAADCLGLGQQSGFGWKQFLLLTLGAGLFIASWLFLWLLRTGRFRIGPHLWPSIRNTLISLLHTGWCRIRLHLWPSFRVTLILVPVSVMTTAIDIHFSTQLGLLAYPPVYDGITYVQVAKSYFHILQTGGLDPAPVSNVLFAWHFTFAPLWETLMLVSFWLLGEGEWQAYTVRFWPTLLLLLLMFWVARRRGGATVAWLAVLFTALLPTISVGLRSSGREYFTGTNVFGSGWYLADLRPDLLFAALLLWTVVPLIECVDNLDLYTWFVTGTAAALAILAKSSTTPVLLLAGGLTVIYVLIVNRHRLLATMTTAAWGIVPFAILLIPWALVGGPRTVVMYLSHHLTVGRPLWSNPNATFLSEAKLYWQFLPFHMGPWEGWLFLGIGLVLWLARVWRKRERGGDRLLAYLLVAGAMYALVSATPNKNLFLGLPYYLTLWLFSWAVLASFLTALSQRGRIAHISLILFSTLYGGVVVGAAFYALHHSPVEKRLRPLESREATQRMATDLRALLTNNDTFMWVPIYGNPPALQYYMMDKQGLYPHAGGVDPTTSPPIPQFLRENVSPCKAVLVFEEDIEEVAKNVPVNPLSFPYWRAISDWVKRPESPYRRVRTYRLWGQFPDHPILVHLYVKEPGESPEGGTN